VWHLQALKLARKRAASENPLRVRLDAPPELAVGRHHPDRRLELRHTTRDLVVGGVGALPDESEVVAGRGGPCVGEPRQVGAWQVRPDRATDVLRVDENRCDGGYCRRMRWRFQRRKRIVPGVTLNLSRRGAGISVGPRGAKVSAGPRGITATLSLLGTGLAYVWRKRR
jgi:hypothetical protein